MNYKMMGKFISQILMVEVIFMIPALLISLVGREADSVRGFLTAILVTLSIASALYVLCRHSRMRFYAKEGMVCVALCWMVMSLLGCLPFWVSGEIPGFIDALFEMVSGFTTTGASILGNVEGMSNGCLYWRSFSHWVGGMGVLVFLLALAPSGEHSNGFTMHLLRAESPGPNVGKLVPRMRQTARILYVIYVALTVADMIFLLCGGMAPLEAVCTALGTAGTGGFGVKNDSMAGYSPYLQNVTTVFMLLFGVNFSCYYLLMLRHLKAVWKDEELRVYAGMVLLSIVLITMNVRGFYGTLGETVRHAAFQVASIITTTGFATTDFELWPGFSKGILFALMLVGGCAGSTSGGLKCSRGILLFKNLKRNMRRLLNPQRVELVRLNGHAVSETVLENTNVYLAAYMILIVGSFLAVSVDGFSMMTNLSAVVACFNNIGPGFEAVGATCNYAGFSAFSKIVLILDMLAGRLEIFPLLLLFSRSTWRHR